MYKFRNLKLQKDCSKHPSCGTNKEFQRLEFLGDKILSFYLSNILFNKCSTLTEGQLTIALSNLVNQRVLASKASRIISVFQFKTKPNESILSDCFEAWLAAIFLDGGDVESIIFKMFKNELLNVLVSKDSKNILQEFSQQYGLVPEYTYIKDNTGQFVCTVKVDKYIGIGKGSSKKQSSRNAAEALLSKMN